MKAVLLNAPNDYTYQEAPKPQCPTGGLLLKVHSVGLCGSDLRKLKFGSKKYKYPMQLGHEVAAEVVESQDASGRFKVGDRVVPAIGVPCGECFFCKKNLPNLCEHLKTIALGYSNDPDDMGGYAQYMPINSSIVNDGLILRIADHVTYDQAVMTEPFTGVFNAQKLIPVEEGDVALVIGAGPIGSMHVELLKSRGATTILADFSEGRLEMAKKAVNPDYIINPGKDNLLDYTKSLTEGRGADVVIVACSSNQAQQESIYLVRKGGHVVFYGGLPEDKPMSELDGNRIHYGQITIHGSFGSGLQEYRDAMEKITAGEIDPEKYITVKKLSEFEEAVKMVERGEVLKVVFHPWEE